MKRLIVLILACLFAMPTFGGGLVQNGYTFRSGLWWRNGVGYQGYRTSCGSWKYRAAAYASTQSSAYTTTDNSISIVNNYVLQQSPSAQGSTLYGYGQTLPYAYLDSDAALNQASRLVTQGQSVWQAAFSERTAADVEVARLEAKTRLLAQLDQPEQTGPSFAVNIEGDGQVSQNDNTQVNGDGQYQALESGGLDALFVAKCDACHVGAEAKGGLDLSQWDTFDLTRRREVLAKVAPNLPDGERMPLNPDGTSAPPLTPTERGVMALEILEALEQ